MSEISCAEKTMLLLTYLLSPQLRQLHLELRGLTRLHGVRPGEDASAHRRGERTADHAVEPVVVVRVGPHLPLVHLAAAPLGLDAVLDEKTPAN